MPSQLLRGIFYELVKNIFFLGRLAVIKLGAVKSLVSSAVSYEYLFRKGWGPTYFNTFYFSIYSPLLSARLGPGRQLNDLNNRHWEIAHLTGSNPDTINFTNWLKKNNDTSKFKYPIYYIDFIKLNDWR